MLSYVRVTRYNKDGSHFNYGRYSVQDQCKKTAAEIVSAICNHYFSRFFIMPYVSLQIIEDGDVDKWTYFITPPLESHVHFTIRFDVINDLPF